MISMPTAIRQPFRLVILFLMMAGFAGVAFPDGEKRLITETDLYSFQWIADPQISPDGSKVVYTHVTVNKKKDGYDTALWITSASGGPPRQLTEGPRDTSARWSPDGRQLAFTRSLEKNGKPDPAQIYLLPMQGGEAR